MGLGGYDLAVMFAIPTLPKLILIVVVIAAVWWFFRRARARRDESRSNAKGTTSSGAVKQVEDMVQCRKCGAYVPLGAPRCGKENCPM